MNPINRRSDQAATIAIVATVSFLVSMIPAIFGIKPHPGTHDELAYLLQADTFAHGRLTNPPHKFWQAFETFHVIQQPTYAAKFPPGQGIALAIGQIIWQPILGAWLATTVACAAIAWLMLAYFPWRWAVLGGLLAAGSYTAFYSAQTFWGASVAIIGGALLGGAAARIARTPTFAMGIIAAIGMGILANSRPFEGLIYSIIVWLLVIFDLKDKRLFWRRVVPAVAITMLPTFIWMGYYNWRVTGNALEMPYVEYQKQYAVAPLMFWQKPSPQPVYRHEIMRKFHTGFEYDEYEKQMTWPGYFVKAAAKIVLLARGYFNPHTIAIFWLIGCLMIFRDRAARWAIIICIGTVVIHLLATPWLRVQYFAPALGFFLLLAVIGARQLWSMRFGKILVIALLIAYACEAVYVDINFTTTMKNWPGRQRQELLEQMASHPDTKYLVIVRYGPQHRTIYESVYNAADIDASQVVFARDMGTAANLQLLKYFHDRAAMFWDVDKNEITPLQTPG
jgi:hypothetical protein